MEMERPNVTNALGSNTKRPRAIRNGRSHSFGVVRSTKFVSSPVTGVQEHKDYPKGTAGGGAQQEGLSTGSKCAAPQRLAPRGKGASKFRGVSLTRKGVWRAVMYKERRQIYLGSFESEVEAAMRYDRASREHFGDMAYTNFDSEEAARQALHAEERRFASQRVKARGTRDEREKGGRHRSGDASGYEGGERRASNDCSGSVAGAPRSGMASNRIKRIKLSVIDPAQEAKVIWALGTKFLRKPSPGWDTLELIAAAVADVTAKTTECLSACAAAAASSTPLAAAAMTKCPTGAFGAFHAFNEIAATTSARCGGADTSRVHL